MRGLDPAAYDAAPLASRLAALRASQRPAAAEIAELDVALTTSVARLFRDVHQGRVDPRTMGFDYDVSSKLLDLPARLREARDGPGCAATFAALEPPYAVYRRLIATLADYRARAAQGEPPLVPPLPPGQRKVEPGKPWAGATALAARLRVFGEPPADGPPLALAPDGTPLYDGPLVAALPHTPANLDQVATGKLVLRQRPGPKNSLGLAKFIFPNANNVYMHGTPVQQLFSRARRDYSHGCIRVEDPPRLAEWVLRANADWDRSRIEAAMAGERPTQVNLADHVNVIIFYDTVTVDPDGVVHFADDYYRHDARLEQALRREG